MKRALITGITGQDGSYLAEFLLEKGLADTYEWYLANIETVRA
jgi:GDP-D-mannose dehydratase